MRLKTHYWVDTIVKFYIVIIFLASIIRRIEQMLISSGAERKIMITFNSYGEYNLELALLILALVGFGYLLLREFNWFNKKQTIEG